MTPRTIDKRTANGTGPKAFKIGRRVLFDVQVVAAWLFERGAGNLASTDVPSVVVPGCAAQPSNAFAPLLGASEQHDGLDIPTPEGGDGAKPGRWQKGVSGNPAGRPPGVSS